MLTKEQIIADISQTLQRAGTSFRADQTTAYQNAIAVEQDELPRWALQNILDNTFIGERKQLPLCDDTGIPHLLLELGDEAVLPAGFLSFIEEGIRQGLRELPGRPMAVKGDEWQRLDQSQGLYDDPGMVEAAPVQIRRIPGAKIRLTILMYGGGPEIRGKTLRVFHQHSLETVKLEMIQWGTEAVKLLGCLPAVLSFGIGRSNLEAASLSLEAMVMGSLDKQNCFEQEIANAINATNIGPLALGGQTTVLGVFVKIGPQRASGVRVVSMRAGCCYDPRRASVEW